MAKLVIRVDDSLHRAAKVKAFLLGQSLESVVAGLLDGWVGAEDRKLLADIAARLSNGTKPAEDRSQEAGPASPARVPRRRKVGVPS